jgi:alpha-tubulin suppressor-like RCC1 family protein
MKLLRIVIVVATALAMVFIHSASQATTRARTVAETVLNDSSVRLSVRSAHTCQVNDDGTVRCWGLNFRGQLGDGSTTDRFTAVAVSGLTTAVAITAGRIHTCTLLAKGGASSGRGHPFVGRSSRHRRSREINFFISFRSTR